MNDQDLREMIRASIARHTEPVRLKPVTTGTTVTLASVVSGFSRTDPDLSFARLPILRSGDDDGMCVIEPSVRCNHCGYCLSYGH